MAQLALLSEISINFKDRWQHQRFKCIGNQSLTLEEWEKRKYVIYIGPTYQNRREFHFGIPGIWRNRAWFSIIPARLSSFSRTFIKDGATPTTLGRLFAPIFNQRTKIMDGQVVKLGNKLSLLFYLFTYCFLPLEDSPPEPLESVLCDNCWSLRSYWHPVVVDIWPHYLSLQYYVSFGFIDYIPPTNYNQMYLPLSFRW